MGQNRFTKLAKYATGAHPHTVPGRVCKHDETLTFKGVIEQAFAGRRDERLPISDNFLRFCPQDSPTALGTADLGAAFSFWGVQFLVRFVPRVSCTSSMVRSDGAFCPSILATSLIVSSFTVVRLTIVLHPIPVGSGRHHSAACRAHRLTHPRIEPDSQSVDQSAPDPNTRAAC